MQAEGIGARFHFHPERLGRRAAEIRALLRELPDEFQLRGGGGWSFLNACQDRHGTLWTGSHSHVEVLLCLGVAIGAARWMMPRDLWPSLPGGMPYVVVIAEDPAGG